MTSFCVVKSEQLVYCGGRERWAKMQEMETARSSEAAEPGTAPKTREDVRDQAETASYGTGCSRPGPGARRTQA